MEQQWFLQQSEVGKDYKGWESRSNFIKFGVEAMGSSSKDEVNVWRMIVSSVATVMTDVFQIKKIKKWCQVNLPKLWEYLRR